MMQTGVPSPVSSAMLSSSICVSIGSHLPYFINSNLFDSNGFWKLEDDSAFSHIASGMTCQPALSRPWRTLRRPEGGSAPSLCHLLQSLEVAPKRLIISRFLLAPLTLLSIFNS